MSRSNSPSRLTPDDRMAEIGGLLASGYRRLRLCREKGLDVSADVERSCGATKSKTAQEAP